MSYNTGMRILLVEDERRLSNVVKKGLTEEGFAIDTAFDGEEGQYLAESENYDLIILDIMLPKVSGTEVLSVLKSRPRVKEIPVLMCTILNKLNEVEKCYELGASGYITKPYDPKRVIDKVRSIFEAS